MNRILREDSVNPNLKNISFPWPCKVDIRGNEIKKDMRRGVKYPFDAVYNLESANPQAMGVKPLTYIQQVLAVCTNKDQLKSDLFPSDVKQRAINILDNCMGNNIGAYSSYKGIPGVRKQIAKFLEKRDGVPVYENDIHLTSGASEGVHVFLELFSHIASEKPVGILIPIPQYPLFKAEIARQGLQEVFYYLDEEKDWCVDIKDLQRAVDQSRSTCDVKVLVIINPANPASYLMTREDIEEIVKFAYKENLLILVDEVYQQNAYYPNRPFISFKKVMYELGSPYRDMELASFMSASKGFMGECGVRIGFIELINVEEKVRVYLENLLVLRICTSTLGQAVMYCICNPPEPGEPSYELYEKEKNAFLLSTKQNIEYGNKKFNSVRGLSSSLVDCSMFFYPRVYLPEKAIKEAKTLGMEPDEMYCLQMVEQTGIVTLPGCEFGQKPGTYHFRYSFLFPPRLDNAFVDKIVEFHENFMKKYAD